MTCFDRVRRVESMQPLNITSIKIIKISASVTINPSFQSSSRD